MSFRVARIRDQSARCFTDVGLTISRKLMKLEDYWNPGSSESKV